MIWQMGIAWGGKCVRAAYSGNLALTGYSMQNFQTIHGLPLSWHKGLQKQTRRCLMRFGWGFFPGLGNCGGRSSFWGGMNI